MGPSERPAVAAAGNSDDPAPCSRPFKCLGRGPYTLNGAEIWAAPNLPLAACPRVGHIRVAGDVAEWLKAAVC